MADFLCGINPFRRKLEGDKDLSIKDRENIALCVSSDALATAVLYSAVFISLAAFGSV